MGGPPAWATKLVKPEVAVNNAPSHLGGGGLSGRGGKSRRCARNSRVKKPTIPATTLPSSRLNRSEDHTSELQSLMRISYAVFCLKKNTKIKTTKQNITK